tara:strand:+ start:10585 stop:10833 length:249 start_codon:yes stop_codon:yes gene_type:complete
MSKLKNIINGWANYIWPNIETEKLAKARAKICAGCIHSVKAKYEILKDDRIEEVKNHICDMCLCPLSAKLRSKEETCPLDKW